MTLAQKRHCYLAVPQVNDEEISKKNLLKIIFVSVCFQDDLSTLSGDATTFGDIAVSLQNEDILPDYTIRTVKVKMGDTIAL